MLSPFIQLALPQRSRPASALLDLVAVLSVSPLCFSVTESLMEKEKLVPWEANPVTVAHLMSNIY